MSMLIADESNFDCQYSRVYIGYRVAEMRNPSVGRWSLPGGHTQNARMLALYAVRPPMAVSDVAVGGSN